MHSPPQLENELPMKSSSKNFHTANSSLAKTNFCILCRVHRAAKKKKMYVFVLTKKPSLGF